MQCHGCSGKGWVDSQHKGPSQCPICLGKGHLADTSGKYNQDAIWLDMVRNCEDPIGIVIERETKALVAAEQVEIVVHALFEKNITPGGSILFNQIYRGQKLSEDELRMRNYILEDGKVKTINDIPVGIGVVIFQTWGNELLSKGHITSPISIDPNRKGNPLFIDNNMAAVCAKFSSTTLVSPGLTDLIRIAGSDEMGNQKVVNIKLFALGKN